MTLISIFMMTVLFTDKPQKEVFFEYRSSGTYSRLEFHVKVFTDRKVHYKKMYISPPKVLEEWTGSLTESGYETFVNDVIEKCRFMELPEKIVEPVNVKDASVDLISVMYNSVNHSIGGYGAYYYNNYKCVYSSYSKMLFSVKNIKYKVKTGS